MRLSSSNPWMWIVVFLPALATGCWWIAGSDWPVQAQEKPATKEPDVLADIDEAIRLLEAKDGKAFIDKYAPVEELRRMRMSNEVDRTAAGFSSAEAAPIRAKLVTLLKKLKGLKPTYDQSRGIATFTYESAPGETASATVTKAEPPMPTTPPEPGFGADLKTVLAQAAQTLEKQDYQSFIEKMYPPSMVRRMQQPGNLATFLDLLAKNPAMPQAMLDDFKSLQGQQPKLTANGTVAEFSIAKADAKPRIVKFQKIGEDWRLFDDSKRVDDEISRVSKLKPPAVPAVTESVQFERLGGNWRFLKMPLN